MSEAIDHRKLFVDLLALAESAFPKRCRSCGREFASAAEFIAATHAVHPNRSGLKQGRDDDDNLIVELFRNCPCGSTLMESFHDRRDLSAAGIRHRQRFSEVLEHLVAAGVPSDLARAELLKFMHGQANILSLWIREMALVGLTGESLDAQDQGGCAPR